MSDSIHRPTDWRKYNRRRDALWPTRQEVAAELAEEREQSRARAQRFQDVQRGSIARRLAEQQAELAGRGKEIREAERRQTEAQTTVFEAEAAEAQRKQEEQDFVWEFTPQQRQKMSTLQNAKQGIMGNPDFDDLSKAEVAAKIDHELSLIQKQRRPRRPDEPIYEPGPNGEPRGEGDSWTDETGALITREKGGALKLLVRPDQRHEFLVEKARQAREEKIDTKIEAELFKLKTKEIDDVEVVKEGGFFPKTKEKPVKRLLTDKEVNRLMSRGFGAKWNDYLTRQQPQQPQQPQEIPQQESQPEAAPVFEGEPEAVEQAREILANKATFGMGLKAVKERRNAKKVVEAWNLVQKRQEQKRHTTKAEYNKLPSRAVYWFNGTPMRKP